MPDGGTLYAAVLCRLPEVRSGCRSKSAKRRPIRHTRRKRGEDPWRIGARFPGESSENGDFRPKTKKVPSEERSKPYISRCRVSYCRRRRRVATTDGGLPARQRAWAGVTSVRKWPAGGEKLDRPGKSRLVRNARRRRRSGGREIYAFARAFADNVDEGGAHRASPPDLCVGLSELRSIVPHTPAVRESGRIPRIFGRRCR